MGAERWAISKRKWTINSHHHHNIIWNCNLSPLKFVHVRPISFNNMTIFINIAPLKIRKSEKGKRKNPKIRKRWPIVPFENNHFVQGRPPKILFKINGSAWCNGGISEFDVIDDGSNPNEGYNSSSSSLPPRPPRLNWSHFTSTSLLKSDHWSLSKREVAAQRHPGASGAIFRSLLSSKVTNGHFWREKWYVNRNRPFWTDKKKPGTGLGPGIGSGNRNWNFFTIFPPPPPPKTPSPSPHRPVSPPTMRESLTCTHAHTHTRTHVHLHTRLTLIHPDCHLLGKK